MLSWLINSYILWEVDCSQGKLSCHPGHPSYKEPLSAIVPFIMPSFVCSFSNSFPLQSCPWCSFELDFIYIRIFIDVGAHHTNVSTYMFETFLNKKCFEVRSHKLLRTHPWINVTWNVHLGNELQAPALELPLSESLGELLGTPTRVGSESYLCPWHDILCEHRSSQDKQSRFVTAVGAGVSRLTELPLGWASWPSAVLDGSWGQIYSSTYGTP